MLQIDRTRHKAFEKEYADIALDVMTSKRFNVEDVVSDEGWPYYVLSNFYEKLREYELPKIMGLKELHDTGNGYPEEKLRDFMKEFFLATPEQIRKANCHLNKIKEGSPNRIAPFSVDPFLKHFQENDYRAMCDHKDIDGIKYNVRILKSLGMRSCPYCGCEYIGGRGKKILGAELDHFVDKSTYPFFALCLYNLIPSCSACNNHKRNAEAADIISPFEEKADFDSNIGIRLYSRPYVRVANEEYHESCMAVRVTADREDPDYERYKKNIEVFDLEDIYDAFKDNASRYLDRMIRYPRTQVEELEQILAMGGIDEWQGRVRYRHRLEQDLFLDRCAEGTEQVQKPDSKMYTDLYRTYRRPDET